MHGDSGFHHVQMTPTKALGRDQPMPRCGHSVPRIHPLLTAALEVMTGGKHKVDRSGREVNTNSSSDENGKKKQEDLIVA